MAYWLFQVMYDQIEGLWPALIKSGLAAQHYPPGWTNESKNLKSLKRLKQGDWVVAAFTGHRFAGYGSLGSDFYRGGPSLKIPRDDGRDFEFHERADCVWTALPLGKEPFLNLHHLKAKGFKVDMVVGLSVRETDEATFLAIKKELDRAGAVAATSISSASSPSSALGRPVDDRTVDEVEQLILTSEEAAIVLQRRGQQQVRQAALASYSNTCALCDVDDPTLLVASHIERWSDNPDARGDLGNVICFCLMHDALFESGYFSLSNDLVVIPNRSTTKATKSLLPENAQFRRPVTSPPKAVFLSSHRKRIGID